MDHSFRKHSTGQPKGLWRKSKDIYQRPRRSHIENIHHSLDITQDYPKQYGYSNDVNAYCTYKNSVTWLPQQNPENASGRIHASNQCSASSSKHENGAVGNTISNTPSIKRVNSGVSNSQTDYINNEITQCILNRAISVLNSKRTDRSDLISRIKKIYRECACESCDCISGKKLNLPPPPVKEKQKCICLNCECYERMNSSELVPPPVSTEEESLKCISKERFFSVLERQLDTCVCKPCDCVSCNKTKLKLQVGLPSEEAETQTGLTAQVNYKCHCNPCECKFCKSIPQPECKCNPCKCRICQLSPKDESLNSTKIKKNADKEEYTLNPNFPPVQTLAKDLKTFRDKLPFSYQTKIYDNVLNKSETNATLDHKVANESKNIRTSKDSKASVIFKFMNEKNKAKNKVMKESKTDNDESENSSTTISNECDCCPCDCIICKKREQNVEAECKCHDESNLKPCTCHSCICQVCAKEREPDDENDAEKDCSSKTFAYLKTNVFAVQTVARTHNVCIQRKTEVSRDSHLLHKSVYQLTKVLTVEMIEAKPTHISGDEVSLSSSRDYEGDDKLAFDNYDLHNFMTFDETIENQCRSHFRDRKENDILHYGEETEEFNNVNVITPKNFKTSDLLPIICAIDEEIKFEEKFFTPRPTNIFLNKHTSISICNDSVNQYDKNKECEEININKLHSTQKLETFTEKTKQTNAPSFNKLLNSNILESSDCIETFNSQTSIKLDNPIPLKSKHNMYNELSKPKQKVKLFEQKHANKKGTFIHYNEMKCNVMKKPLPKVKNTKVVSWNNIKPEGKTCLINPMAHLRCSTTQPHTIYKTRPEIIPKYNLTIAKKSVVQKKKTIKEIKMPKKNIIN